MSSIRFLITSLFEKYHLWQSYYIHGHQFHSYVPTYLLPSKRPLSFVQPMGTQKEGYPFDHPPYSIHLQQQLATFYEFPASLYLHADKHTRV